MSPSCRSQGYRPAPQAFKAHALTITLSSVVTTGTPSCRRQVLYSNSPAGQKPEISVSPRQSTQYYSPVGKGSPEQLSLPERLFYVRLQSFSVLLPFNTLAGILQNTDGKPPGLLRAKPSRKGRPLLPAPAAIQFSNIHTAFSDETGNLPIIPGRSAT